MEEDLCLQTVWANVSFFHKIFYFHFCFPWTFFHGSAQLLKKSIVRLISTCFIQNKLKFNMLVSLTSCLLNGFNCLYFFTFHAIRRACGIYYKNLIYNSQSLSFVNLVWRLNCRNGANFFRFSLHFSTSLFGCLALIAFLNIFVSFSESWHQDLITVFVYNYVPKITVKFGIKVT